MSIATHAHEPAHRSRTSSDRRRPPAHRPSLLRPGAPPGSSHDTPSAHDANALRRAASRSVRHTAHPPAPRIRLHEHGAHRSRHHIQHGTRPHSPPRPASTPAERRTCHDHSMPSVAPLAPTHDPSDHAFGISPQLFADVVSCRTPRDSQPSSSYTPAALTPAPLPHASRPQACS